MKGAMRTWLVALAALAVVAAACGNDEGSGGGATGGGIEPSKTYTSIGEPEGELNLIAWAGYVEDGTSDGGEAYDWVTPFEDDTGCNVNVTYGDTSDEMVTLMRQGGGTRRTRHRADSWRRSTGEGLAVVAQFRGVSGPGGLHHTRLRPAVLR